MVEIKLDKSSTKQHHPVSLTAKFKADTDLVLQCQRYGGGLHKGTAIGKLLEIWPTDALKKQALDICRTFIQHMKLQGYETRESATEMELWGPYREKLDMSKANDLINFEAGNHLIPEGHYGHPMGGWESDGVTGPRTLDKTLLRDHRDWQLGAVFLIRGKFTATRGTEEESTGTILVGGTNG